MRQLAHRLWTKVHQPRVISTLYCAAYIVIAYAGISALVDPPRSIEGNIGAFSMVTLAGLLILGGLAGAPSALLGLWWFERVAVLAIAVSATIYGGIILALHVQGPGNRQLQLGFVMFVLIMQGVRWHRIRERPYDPSRH